MSNAEGTPIVRPGLVAGVYLDLSAQPHPTYEAAYRASMTTLVALELIDQGITATVADATAATLVERFAIALRERT